jgi:hypothetical protein
MDRRALAAAYRLILEAAKKKAVPTDGPDDAKENMDVRARTIILE